MKRKLMGWKRKMMSKYSKLEQKDEKRQKIKKENLTDIVKRNKHHNTVRASQFSRVSRLHSEVHIPSLWL